jgi:hypothetical protein
MARVRRLSWLAVWYGSRVYMLPSKILLPIVIVIISWAARSEDSSRDSTAADSGLVRDLA